jgi:MFS family permease
MTAITTDETSVRRIGSRRWALPTLLAGQMMASLDTSVVSVAAPSIRRDLHVGGPAVQLVLAGYVLAYAVLLVTGARLGGDYGQRRLFLVGAGGFTTCSLLSGVAPNLWVLVAAQAGLGASAALMVPQVLSLIHLTFSGAARERAVGLYSMVLAVGVALGQVLGGALTTVDVAGLGWRSVFLVNVPVGLLLLVAAPATLPAVEGRGARSLDLPGVLTLAAAMVLLVVPLTFGPSLSWPRWAWACLAGVPVAGAGFVAVELAALRGGREPLLDLTALRQPGVTPALLVVLATMGSYGGLIFTLSQFLQAGLAFTPLAAGLSFTPYAAGFAAVSLCWARLAPRTQRWLPSAGLTALAAATAVLAARLGPGLGSGSGPGWSAALLPLLLLGGAGHAAAFSPLVAQIANRVGSRAPAFSALVTTTMQVAILVGVAALGSLYAAAVEGGAATGNAFALVCGAVAVVSILALGASLRVAVAR